MFARILSRYWWMVLLRGVISVLFGITVFAWPQISLVAFVLVFGTFVLADGLANVMTAIGGRTEHNNWWVLLLAGLAGVAVGVMTFLMPGITALVLLFYIAAWALVTGVLQIVAAIRLRKEIEGEFWLGLAGLASVIFGMLLVARPGEGALAVLWIIASYAIALGVILIILALRARGFVNRIRAAAAF